MAHDVVLDLIIESEARRAHDVHLAQMGAEGDALKEFTDVINQDIAAGKTVQKTYTFDKVSLSLFLPKYSSQAARLVGVTLVGTSTFITRDKAGNVVDHTTPPYSKSWGLDTGAVGVQPCDADSRFVARGFDREDGCHVGSRRIV